MFPSLSSISKQYLWFFTCSNDEIRSLLLHCCYSTYSLFRDTWLSCRTAENLRNLFVALRFSSRMPVATGVLRC